MSVRGNTVFIKWLKSAAKWQSQQICKGFNNCIALNFPLPNPSFPLVIQPKPENAITIGVSARVLFNMEKEQQIYEQQGMEEYIKYQVEHENEPFSPGPAFSFVKVRERKRLYVRTASEWAD